MKTTRVALNGAVVCDICNADYTESDERGGLIFGSYAYCPRCAVDGLDTIKAYGEEAFIRAYCPPEQSFADFVRGQRGDGDEIVIYSAGVSAGAESDK